ncbi:MAG TPA: SRPBCC family protein [Baekduia sp.]|uniref:SRPBCC family protein n=1 Tax=Baekduia sp. TaxID=2600305 RepID=UPI002C0FC876|nr:SRPBCC family protein [Baekduia sp.]HMJ35244.1 SRPBCC family protein [Baekduia sp.]
MDPVEVEVTIARPRREVFAYLQDVANHAEFSDHYLVRWHLTREDTLGEGAGARFKLKARFTRYAWADVTFVEVQEPRLIVERGRGGKYNRILNRGVYELEEVHGGASTRVTYTFETKPKLFSDRFQESMGRRGWYKRKSRKALRRMQAILEEGRDRGARVTLADGPRKPFSNFRFRPEAFRPGANR